jgi:integrating conjugative element membrane protein (TIGR03745 family)/integrating conjugative element protein (TIGR03758 family)
VPEFALGAGFEASVLLHLIASLVAAIAIIWAAWVCLGQFESWAAGSGSFLDASLYLARGLVPPASLFHPLEPMEESHMTPRSMPSPISARDFWRATFAALLAYGLLIAATSAFADLPPAPSAPGGASGSDFIDFFQGYAGQAVATIILIVGAVIFVVVAWLAIEALMEAVSGKGSWATVIVLGLVGAGVLVFDLFLLNTANTVFEGAL